MPHRNRRVEYYPRFSDGEYDRRLAGVRSIMDDEGLDAVVVYGHSAAQTSIHYLTNYWGGHHNYYVCFRDPAEPGTLFIGLSNLRQYALETAVVDDVRYGGAEPDRAVADRLAAADVTRVGIVGIDPRFGTSVPHGHFTTFAARFDGVRDVTGAVTRQFAVHSAEQVAWVERGAAFTDRAMEAAVDLAEVGMREHELQGALEAAYRREGGDTLISFLSSAPMEGAEPGEAFPWKRKASTRRIRRGDVITTELSAAYWGYAGQLHRPIAVGGPPTDAYLDVYDVCRETYRGIVGALEPGATAADVHDAMAPLEESPYEIQDVVVHGFGMTYGPPFVGTTASNYWPGREDPTTREWVVEPGMVVVVQPNAFTPDERQGLQLGNTLVVREDGAEPLHDHPLAFHQV